MSFKLKAVISDDSGVMRKILKEILEKENFDVVGEAGDGYETLDLCARHLPNLLTLDIAIPGPDGIEILKKVKAAHKSIRVVMVTSLDTQEAMIEALELGAEGYVTKPYQPEKVARVISCIEY